MDNKRVLIVEDEENLAKLYQSELELQGLSVEVASNGQEGFQKAQENPPDLVLIDIIMPELNGIDLLKKLQENEQTKKIIALMLTNYGDEVRVKEAFNAGATDYILKYQSTPAEVAQKVTQYLRKTPNATAVTEVL